MIALSKNQMLHRQHLHFIKTHRSKLEQDGANLYVLSERAQYTYAVLGDGGSDEAVQLYSAVHFLPWSGDWKACLKSHSFEPKEIIDYMVLDGSWNGWRENEKVSIKVATTSADLELFSQIQGRAFIPDETTYQEWYPWLLEKNLENLNRPEQKFYIGFVGDRPAGTCLTIAAEDTLGIYAVGTLSEFRKQGVATAVMKRALEHAPPAESTVITLQTAGGSEAERLYFDLGFSSAFVVQVYRKQETQS